MPTARAVGAASTRRPRRNGAGSGGAFGHSAVGRRPARERPVISEGDDYVSRARALAETVRAGADDAERSGQLSDSVVAALSAAGFFRMMVPRRIGGGEADIATLVDTIDAVSRADGATGWIVMIGATTGLSCTQLGLESAKEIFGDPGGLVVGVV